MQTWERALNKFLQAWSEREDVVGIMVCGSYVTGDPTNRSDIDLHILLSDEVDWRERGNEYVDGFLIEYFANPPRQIRRYFADDFSSHSTASMIQFMTGKVLFDPHGLVKQLQAEAAVWKAKDYAPLDPASIEVLKYGLWDTFDNLLAAYEEQRDDFDFVYQQSLCVLFRGYSRLLNLEVIPFDHIARYLMADRYLDKYLKAPFPDTEFATEWLKAMNCIGRDDKIEHYESLQRHVFQETGGFAIDGWRLKTPVEG